jgi:uncharacterized protein (DUF697 family)
MSTNKKKLPKAIRRTTDDPRQGASARAMDMKQPTGGAAAAPFFALEGEVVGPAPPSPAAGALVVQRRAPTEFNAVRRLSQAQAIVERHATYSAAGGLVPLPIINVASVTAIILRMVKRLSNLYGVPFERDRARAIVVGLAGGAMPTGLAAVTTSTLHYLVPGSAFIGLAVSSVTAVACTRSIGRIFVEHFESGETLRDFPTIEQR